MPLRRVLAAALLLALAPSPARAETVQSLLQKNAAARGGKARLDAIQSLRLTGRLLVGGGVELAVDELKARPARVRVEATIQGLTMVQACDGEAAWTIQPFEGRKDPERLDPDERKALLDEAAVEGVLLASAARGEPMRLLGTEEVGGADAWVLEISRPGGDRTVVYLDTDHFLEVRVTTTRSVRGAQVEEEVDLGEYEQVAGAWFPFAIATGEPGSQRKRRLVVDRAEANVPVDAAAFRFPAAPAPAAK